MSRIIPYKEWRSLYGREYEYEFDYPQYYFNEYRFFRTPTKDGIQVELIKKGKPMNLQDKLVKDCTKDELERALALKTVKDLTYRNVMKPCTKYGTSIDVACEQAWNYGYKYFTASNWAIYEVRGQRSYSLTCFIWDDVK
jgi:hypothetical protein